MGRFPVRKKAMHKKLLSVLLLALFVMQVISGCAQRQEGAYVEAAYGVYPEVTRWDGGYGETQLTPGHPILYADNDDVSGEIAQLLAEDIKAMFGWEMETIAGSRRATDGGIVLSLVHDKHLGEEGYRIDIGNAIRLSATTRQGLYWASRTLLQMMDAGRPSGLSEEERLSPPSVALGRGKIFDVPAYPVRGFEFDVARNAVSMRLLYNAVDTLSWFKMNELVIHLNDNELIEYSGAETREDVFDLYAAFRLESEIRGEDGMPLTAQDLSYGKEEFRALVAYARSRGVTIIPEIDMPSHALCLTRCFPEYALEGSLASAAMLDVADPAARELAISVWKEYIEGEDAAFADCPVVHIGGDEYYGGGDDYVRFENELIAYLRSQGKTVRLWGSVGGMNAQEVMESDGVQMCIWDTSVWADAQKMYDAGFQLINTLSGQLYVIPGGGYDYPDTEAMLSSFQVNRFPAFPGTEAEAEEDGMITLPEDPERMLGACAVLWNDFSGTLSVGITEYDMYDRFLESVSVLSHKTWNPQTESSHSSAAQEADRFRSLPVAFVNPYDRLPVPEISVDFEEPLQTDATIPLDLSAYGLPELTGPPYEAEIRLRVEEPDAGTVLFETIRDGQGYRLMANGGEGCAIGIDRENEVLFFEEMMPADRWVTLKLVAKQNTLSLYLDDEFYGTIGSDAPFEPYATFLLPLGHTRFTGEIASITLRGVKF